MIQVREAAKRCVFSRRLKVPSVCDAVTLDGKLFQTRAEQRRRRPGHQSSNDAMMHALREQTLTQNAAVYSSCVDVRHTTQLVRQVRWSRTMQTAEHEHSELKLNSLAHRQPIKVVEYSGVM